MADELIILTADQKILRGKVDFIFRLLFDMGGIMPRIFHEHDIQTIVLTQLMTTSVKLFHVTRAPGQVDTVEKPTPHVIEVGRIFQVNMNLLFNALEQQEAIHTPTIPMAIRQAPLFELYTNRAAEQIESVYSKPEIYLPEEMNGMKILS